MNEPTVTPLTLDDLSGGAEAKDFSRTPAGEYCMALQSVGTKTKNGVRNVTMFFKHVDASSGYKGVELNNALEGTFTNKAGKQVSRALFAAKSLMALGISDADAVEIVNGANGSEIRTTGSADADWKSAAARIVLRGDDITDSILGREVAATVEEYTSETSGKTYSSIKKISAAN